MHWIKEVRYLKEYKLEIIFDDDHLKMVDLKSFTGGNGVFKELKDTKYFKKVKKDPFSNTICWPNGADICPDVLYEIGKTVEYFKV